MNTDPDRDERGLNALNPLSVTWRLVVDVSLSDSRLQLWFLIHWSKLLLCWRKIKNFKTTNLLTTFTQKWKLWFWGWSTGHKSHVLKQTCFAAKFDWNKTISVSDQGPQASQYLLTCSYEKASLWNFYFFFVICLFIFYSYYSRPHSCK